MPARWLSMTLVVCCAAFASAQERPGRVQFASLQAPEQPTLLPVPESAPTPTTRKHCKSCPNEYNPSHAYLPDHSPDCRSGGCDGDCEPCRQFWCGIDFFIGVGDNLPNVDRKFLYGAVAEAGYWFSEDRTTALQLGFWFANGSYRDSQLPTLIDSPLTITTGDANIRAELFTHDGWRIDGLVGYRYLHFHEKYQITGAALTADLTSTDTLNAPQIGVIAEHRYGPYFVEAALKLAYGRFEQTNDINSKRVTRTDWTLMPTFGANVGYQLGESIWGTLGYQMLFISEIDRPNSPKSDYMLHGFTVGLVKRF